jgi:hypothetical protein
MIKLYGVSEKPDKNGDYKLVKFKNKAFNEVMDEAKIEETLTNLVNDLYGHEDGCRWFHACVEDDSEEVEVLCFDLNDGGVSWLPYSKRLEIQNIMDLIDAGSGVFQYFILVNGKRTEYQWVVSAWQSIVYSG